VAILAHRLSELDTPAFRAFLAQAAASFHQNVQRLRTKPEDLMPWKLNGERWHLGDKGYPPGQKVLWDRTLLPRLLDLIRAVEPNVEVRWDVRDAVTLRVPGVSRMWARLRTKDPAGLDCWFLGKRAQFNLSRVEEFGVSPQIESDRSDGDALRLIFRHADHLHADRLKELLAEHLRGFREAFGEVGSSA
jgi:excinuclease ABC subunit A